mgnify:CR=1 FL=1
MHCCTAISDLQIESAFTYLQINGQTENGPKSLERGNIMSMMSTFKNWRNYRNTVAELNTMSQRELDDMGIARANIREIARRAVR